MVATATVACLWMAICQVGGSYVTLEMNRTIQNLLQHYRIRPNERFNGKPVFSRDLPSTKIEANMVYMGGILETYEKLIGHMLKQLPTSNLQTTGSHMPTAVTSTEMRAGGDVKSGLSYILKKIQDLRKRRYQEHEKILHRVQALQHIQMDNLVIQSKALWELPWLYEEASSLPNNIVMRRRRRRRRQLQAKRVKTNRKKQM